MLAPIFQTLPDTLHTVSLFLNPKQAAMLSEVNKFCRERLHPMDTRYKEAIHAWPWLSEPQRIRSRCRSAGLDATKLSWCLGDNCLIVTANINYGDMQSFTLPMRPEQEEDFVSTVFPVVHNVYDDPRYVNVFQQVDTYDTRPYVLASAIREPERHEAVSQVRYPLDVMFVTNRAQRIQNDQPVELSIIRCDTHTLLRRIGYIGAAFPPILYRQGEMWMVDHRTGDILYYGPRVDRLLNTNVSGRVWSARIHATCARIIPAIRILTERGDSSVNTRFADNETVLITLARVVSPKQIDSPGFKQQLQDLRTYGADFNAYDMANMTALKWAFYKKSATMAKLLLYHGATFEPDAISDLIRSAGDSRHPDRCFNVIDALLEHGDADINFMDKTRPTPLMVATTTLNLEAVNYLLAKGADPFLQFEGQTARDMLFDTDWAPPVIYIEGDESDGFEIAKALDRVMAK